ncbi:MAG: MBL fold metallo-hydrolase [Bacteroidetes bacterium]|nr:MBL fold metallo-hydrolase [Bacteroidota bacterium]MDA0985765.1 MBL fold metallo-hydrolase [Bacteroidota bacterium]
MLTIHFLGTGTSQGVPVIGSSHPVCLSTNPKDKRLRVSVLIQWGDTNLVIDCGPDFRQQMLRVNCAHLDGILFTHEHADHTAGLDDIRPYFFRQGDIPIYATQHVLDNLSNRFDYIFFNENKYPGAPNVQQHQIDANTPFVLDGMTVIPVEVYHNTLPVLGFRILNFCYLTDVKTISTGELKKLHDLDVLVLSALRIEPHSNHLNLEEALSLIRLINPKRAYLTHISHLMGFHDEVSKNLPKNVFLAYDTLTVTSN